MNIPPPGITPVELLADIIDHVPGVISHYPFVPFPPELALPAWACHLGEVWAKPRQLVAPTDYDVAYKNQSPRARVEFLAALRRLQRMVCQALINDYTGNSLFDTVRWKEDAPAPAYSNLELHTLTTRGAAWLLSWLNWRELSPAKQLLTALGTVQISNANLALTEREPERPPLLFIPDCAPQDEAERFRQLLADFKRHLPSKKPVLRGLLARLEPLRALTLDTLPERSVRELPTHFSAVEWEGLHNRPAESSEAETFWPDLAQALRTRAEWAARAYDAIEFVLSKVKAHTPAAPTNPASAVAIIESPQPGSPAPNKGCPQDGDTLDTAPPAALTVADLCRDGFTPADVLALAREVGLADEAGRFC
jgi:hypothetical protein